MIFKRKLTTLSVTPCVETERPGRKGWSNIIPPANALEVPDSMFRSHSMGPVGSEVRCSLGAPTSQSLRLPMGSLHMPAIDNAASQDRGGSNKADAFPKARSVPGTARGRSFLSLRPRELPEGATLPQSAWPAGRSSAVVAAPPPQHSQRSTLAAMRFGTAPSTPPRKPGVSSVPLATNGGINDQMCWWGSHGAMPEHFPK